MKVGPVFAFHFIAKINVYLARCAEAVSYMFNSLIILLLEFDLLFM